MSHSDSIISGNPIIWHKFTTDPTALVHDGRLYLFTGHDEAPVGSTDYLMNDWLCFSTTDLARWEEHPSPWKATDFAWAKGDAYAAEIIERDGRFFFYAPVTAATGKGKAIGVAVADSPTGPFRAGRSTPFITHDMLPPTDNEKANLDPTVLIDDDGQAYIVWGNKVCYFAKLKKNITELDGPISTISLPNFEEGAHLHKRGGWYYLSYGYGSPEKVAYAMSRSITGPWEFKGILNELAGNCEANRPCIVDFKGRSLFFYHNGALKDGGSQRRSVCVNELRYNEDGTIQRVVMTSEGVKPL